MNISERIIVKHVKMEELGIGHLVGGGIISGFQKNDKGEMVPANVPQVMVLWEEQRTPSPSFHSPEELEWIALGEEYEQESDMPDLEDVLNYLDENKNHEVKTLTDVITLLADKFTDDEIVDEDEKALGLSQDEEADNDDVNDSDEKATGDSGSDGPLPEEAKRP